MASRLYVPYLALRSADKDELVVNPPAYCSHCSTIPAEYYETHVVRLRANRIPHRSIGRKFRTEKKLIVRLPLCRACYLNDYLTSPDAYTHDDTPLGKEARRTTLLSNISGFTASIGILLITPFIPALGILAFIKSYWYVLVSLGFVILAVAWLLQRRSMQAVRAELASLRPGGSKYPRALVWNTPVEGDLESGSVILEMNIENETWAGDCARMNVWRIE